MGDVGEVRGEVRMRGRRDEHLDGGRGCVVVEVEVRVKS